MNRPLYTRRSKLLDNNTRLRKVCGLNSLIPIYYLVFTDTYVFFRDHTLIIEYEVKPTTLLLTKRKT